MMRKFLSFNTVVFLLIAASFFLTAAAPITAQAAEAQAQTDLVRLTIKNNTGKTIFIKLEGPTIYNLRAEAEKSTTFTVLRGEYSYSLFACGARATAELDLTRHKTLIMPVCGGAANTAGQKLHKVDLSSTLKMVKVSIENDTPGNLFAILTGPETYVFTFKADQTKTFTIQRGQYTIRYFACADSTTRTFIANAGKELVLECP